MTGLITEFEVTLSGEIKYQQGGRLAKSKLLRVMAPTVKQIVSVSAIKSYISKALFRANENEKSKENENEKSNGSVADLVGVTPVDPLVPTSNPLGDASGQTLEAEMSNEKQYMLLMYAFLDVKEIASLFANFQTLFFESVTVVGEGSDKVMLTQSNYESLQIIDLDNMIGKYISSFLLPSLI